MVWRLVIGDWTGPPERELTLATNRKATFTLTAPATLAFDLPGESDEAALLEEMVTDVWVYGDAVLVFRGRVTALTDTVTADAHTVAVTAVDYRGLLSRRLLVEGDQLNWSNATYAEIAWGLVTATQAKAGGGLGIVQGVWVPDPAQIPSNYRVRNYAAGLEIGKAVDDLAGVAFDYQIDPGLHFNLWAPGKAHISAFVADYGGTVAGFTRATAATSWANVTRSSGDATTTVGVNLVTDNPAGRFEQQIGYPDVTLQDTVAQRAAADHARWMEWQATINVDLRPGIVPQSVDLDVGNTIAVALRSGRLNEVGTRQIQQMTVAVDDNDVPRVRLGLVVAS